MTNKATVMVTAIGGSGHGEQILKAALKVQGLDLRIIGSDIRKDAHQFEWVDESIQLPPANSDEYMDALVHSCEIYGIQAVFHGSEPEMIRISRDRERLIGIGVIPVVNSENVIEICSDKIRTMDYLNEHEFNPPKYLLIQNSADAEKVDFYPVVVKPYKGSGGSANVYIAQNLDELRGLLIYMKRFLDQGLMIQEYVGNSENEFTVGVLSTLDGGVVSSIALRRNLSGSLNIRSRVANDGNIAKFGGMLSVSSGVSEGEFDDFTEIRTFCENIATKLDSRGSINFQGRADSSGLRIFEINPRLSGTTSLRALAGYNEVEFLIRRHVLLQENCTPPVASKATIERGLVEYLVNQ